MWGRGCLCLPAPPLQAGTGGRPPLSGFCGPPPRAPRQPPKGGAAAPPRPHAGPLSRPGISGAGRAMGALSLCRLVAPGPLGPPRRAPGRWGVSRGGGSASRPPGARGSPSGGVYWTAPRWKGLRSRAKVKVKGTSGPGWRPGPLWGARFLFSLRPQCRMPAATLGLQSFGPLVNRWNIQ